MIDELKQASLNHNEPDWLIKRRIAAAKLIDDLPFPKLQRFTYQNWPLTEDKELIFKQTNQDLENDNDDAEDNVIVQLGQTTIQLQTSPNFNQKGVIFTDLFSAIQAYPDLIKKYLHSVTHFNEDKLLAYNQAFLNNGIFLYLPDDVEINEPVEAEIIQDSTQEGNLVSHILIVAGKHSKLNFIQHLSTIGNKNNAANLVVEIIAENESQVTFSSLDEMGENTTLFFNRRANIGRDAHVEWNVAFMNDCNTVGDLASELLGEGSYAYSKAIAITTGNQRVAVNNRVINKGPHSTGLINQRGVLLENSRLIFNGIGQIVHGAHGSKADQQNRVLMMSDHAQGDANPLLLIDENDVIAAHAASVGPVDPIQMEYLMSRGIPYLQAQRMVIHGFLDAVLGAISKGKVKDRMLEILERKLIDGQKEYYKN